LVFAVAAGLGLVDEHSFDRPDLLAVAAAGDDQSAPADSLAASHGSIASLSQRRRIR
jgi:hypothetical protein